MRARPLTPELKRQAADLYRYGFIIREVADMIGSTYGTVHRALDELETEFREPGPQPGTVYASRPGRDITYPPIQIADLYRYGYVIREVAAMLGCSTRTVRRALKVEKVPYRHGPWSRNSPTRRKIDVE